jgi:hypothetical protein
MRKGNSYQCATAFHISGLAAPPEQRYSTAAFSRSQNFRRRNNEVSNLHTFFEKFTALLGAPFALNLRELGEFRRTGTFPPALFPERATATTASGKFSRKDARD